VREGSKITHELLMGRFQNGLDGEAFAQIVSFYTGPALGVAQRMLSDRALAEDAVQETFLRIIRGRRQYRRSRPFSSWFYAILRNVCVDILRKQSRENSALQELASQQVFTAQVVKSSDASDLLRALPRGERDVLDLRIIHNLTFRDISAALGISEEAAKKRAQRGLRRLRESICQANALSHRFLNSLLYKTA